MRTRCADSLFWGTSAMIETAGLPVHSTFRGRMWSHTKGCLLVFPLSLFSPITPVGSAPRPPACMAPSPPPAVPQQFWLFFHGQ
mmetsp:Transcript_2538/g.4058  ORF Transcript_2538/g.4058 Transcript_2538/m.4058 type:complete len:84 (+) Transcript_2538:116-367(+)